MPNHKIIFADSRRMIETPDSSVHLIITSPPYWQLKDYGNLRQIGFNDSYEDYINNLNLVWQECYRVLFNGCRLCINIGDQFARSVYYGRYKVIPIRTEIIKFCESIGFDYMGAIIWQKVTTCNTTGGATIMGSFPYPRNGIIKIDYEFILLFKKPGESPTVSKEIKEKSRLTKEEWNEYFYGHWNFSGERQNKHLAMFPEELPKRLIKMFSFVGDTVLDPFLGSGTTSLAAKNLNRNSIGYEINDIYFPIINHKLEIKEGNIFEDASFEIMNPQRIEFDYDTLIKKLPYFFEDKTKFDKKTNPKKLTFGSKISDSPVENRQSDTLKVKRVVSSEIIELNNNLKVKLIGIKNIESKENEAINWLHHKLKGHNLSLNYDTTKYDSDGNLLVYIYLKNKTFINLHFLRSGLVEFDESIPFKYFNKFKQITSEQATV